MVFKETVHYNLTSLISVVYAIANAISDKGWVIDKIDDQGENVYLYVHSDGNGYQNLYFSFRFYRQSGRNNATFWIAGNTGFDTNQAWNNQPGKWAVSNRASIFGFPLSVLRIYAHHSYVFIHTQSYITDNVSGSTVPLYLNSYEKFFHFSFGSFEIYTPNYSQGNIFTLDAIYSSPFCQGCYYWDGIHSDLAQSYLYFENTTKSTLSDDSLLKTGNYNLFIDYIFREYYSSVTSFYKLGGAATQMTYTNKGCFVKNQIGVVHSVGGYTYRFPFAEYPIWMARFYPYYENGELVILGERKFRLLAMGHYNSQAGYAIEIE